MRILITDSDTRPALAAVRALGRQGHEIISAGLRHPSLASVSRYSTSFARYPDPVHDAAGFVAACADIVERQRVDVVLPITEITTLLITEQQQALPAHCRLPFPSFETVAHASNKAHVVTLAQELDVPTPLSIVVDSAADGVRRAGEIPWPIVIKPARSRVRTSDGWISTGVAYAENATALQRVLHALPADVYPVLLQERIEGPGAGVFACFDVAKPVALFAHRRLREKPPSGGVSVLCESAALDPTAVEHTSRLLARLGWRGVAMVEFKQDRRDGSMRLMEINGRFWGSLQLAIDAGVDFPSIAVALAMGKPLPPPSPYRIGVRSRWLTGDIDSLLLTLLRSRDRLNLPPSHPGRLRSLWNFVHLSGGPTRCELERADDPGPAWLEWRRRLRGRR